MAALLEALKREWATLKKAPFSFVTVLIVGVLLGLWFRDERIAVMGQQISDYEERLNILPPESSYSRLTDEELGKEPATLRIGCGSLLSRSVGIYKVSWSRWIGSPTLEVVKTQTALADEHKRIRDLYTEQLRPWRLKAFDIREEILKRVPSKPETPRRVELMLALGSPLLDEASIPALADHLDQLALLLPVSR